MKRLVHSFKWQSEGAMRGDNQVQPSFNPLESQLFVVLNLSPPEIAFNSFHPELPERTINAQEIKLHSTSLKHVATEPNPIFILINCSLN